MIKIGVLGAGVSGLSVARFLRDFYDVEVIEAKNVCGGIARTANVNEVAYHVVGGHCFNSKYPEILDFVFKEVLPREQWNEIHRVSKIRMNGHEYMYPIEFSVKDIKKDNPMLAQSMIDDFLNADFDSNPNNLADWFCARFGKTLADIYFIPYNRKIWNKEPREMSAEWVKDKLPIPNKQSFLKALNSDVEDTMPHARFFYPKSNNQNTFLDALAEGTHIIYNTQVHSIKKDNTTGMWIVNGERIYDVIVNTTPLDRFFQLLINAPDDICAASMMLKYNKISNVLWKSDMTDKTWTYLPDKTYMFHRYIHIGSYYRPSAGYTITECVGEHGFDELVENGRQDAFLHEPISYHQSDHAYVVFDQNYHYAVPKLLEYLSSLGIYSVGRFAEWQYYNMDVCMKRAMDVADVIKKNIR